MTPFSKDKMCTINGPEFHGAALERGHIERLTGTMTGKVHLLPGTTDASPAARGGYDSEATAVLTFPEFARPGSARELRLAMASEK
jgi:hypothetical protein